MYLSCCVVSTTLCQQSDLEGLYIPIWDVRHSRARTERDDHPARASSSPTPSARVKGINTTGCGPPYLSSQIKESSLGDDHAARRSSAAVNQRKRKRGWRCVQRCSLWPTLTISTSFLRGESVLMSGHSATCAPIAPASRPWDAGSFCTMSNALHPVRASMALRSCRAVHVENRGVCSHEQWAIRGDVLCGAWGDYGPRGGREGGTAWGRGGENHRRRGGGDGGRVQGVRVLAGRAREGRGWCGTATGKLAWCCTGAHGRQDFGRFGIAARERRGAAACACALAPGVVEDWEDCGGARRIPRGF
ncbi:hypothetical protein B0H11DRAFT_538425 [Mycena galericulata]|nr:hypothetical protein B0H11DRAFT_538425 [Mycena galericulata]